MKWLVVVPDGAADKPVASLEGKTPFEKASTPVLDMLASKGLVGMVRTIPENMVSGSDVGNLSLLGYNPQHILTGRASLEALGANIHLKEGSSAFRMNFVSLAKKSSYEDSIMLNYGVDKISDEESNQLIDELKEALLNEKDFPEINLYSGSGFKNIMVAEGDFSTLNLQSAHTFLGEPIRDYLPSKNSDDIKKVTMLEKIIQISIAVFEKSSVNLVRESRGLQPIDAVWFWGQGTAMKDEDFNLRRGLSSALVSGVNIVKGIGRWANMDVADIPTATGTIDTDYDAKVRAVKDAFMEGKDFVFLHIEAPDDCSHRRDANGKVKSIEFIDREILAPLVEFMEKEFDEFSILVAPDHFTFSSDGNHGDEPVPFVIYQKTIEENVDVDNAEISNFSEKTCSRGAFVESGKELIDKFLNR